MSDYAPYEDADDYIAQQACELTRLRAQQTVLHWLLWEALQCIPECSLSERIEQALATLDVPDPKEGL